MKLNIIISLGREKYGAPYNKVCCTKEIFPGDLANDRQEFACDSTLEEVGILSDACKAIEKTIIDFNSNYFRAQEALDADSVVQ